MSKEDEHLAPMHHIMVTVHVYGPDTQALHSSSTSYVPFTHVLNMATGHI